MKKILLPFIALVAVASIQTASADEALFKSKPCVACHTIDTKVVGPSLKEVSAKYADEEGYAATLASHIKNGSSGTWGPIPMPPNPVTDEEATQLAEWILTL